MSEAPTTTHSPSAPPAPTAAPFNPSDEVSTPPPCEQYTAQADPAPEGQLKGKAKLWKEDKGFGFIVGEDGKDIFVHSKANDGLALVPGSDVYYSVSTQPCGRIWAVNINGPGVVPRATGVSPAEREPLPLGDNYRGTVKTWFTEKGYGFILHESGRDVFVHTKGINHGSLIVGQHVSFSIELQQGGRQWATNLSGPGYVPNGQAAAPPQGQGYGYGQDYYGGGGGGPQGYYGQDYHQGGPPPQSSYPNYYQGGYGGSHGGSYSPPPYGNGGGYQGPPTGYGKGGGKGIPSPADRYNPY